jgi:hypothetical protein
MPRAEKETIDQISQLLISEEHTRSSARLEKKNVVHYISSNRQSGLGSPQTSSPSNWDRCNTCMCFHKGECHVKTGKIPDNWSAAKKARIRERIDQFKKHGKVTVANAIDAKDEGPKEQSHKKKRKHIYVSLLDVNGAIGRNGAIDVAKEANGLNAAIEEANGLNAAIEEADEFNAAIEETTDPMDVDQSSISDSKHEFEPGRHQADWYLDSGANAHFCSDLSQFTQFRPLSNRSANLAMSAANMPIQGIGIVEIDLESAHGINTLKIRDVYYSPGIRINVLSPSVIFSKSGIWGQWGKAITLFNKHNDPIGMAYQVNHL